MSVEHVRRLLRSQAPPSLGDQPNPIAQSFSQSVYVHLNHFRFSSRILSVFALTSALIYCGMCMWILLSQFIANALVYGLSGGRCCWNRKCDPVPLSDQWVDGLSIYMGAVEVDVGGGCVDTFGHVGDTSLWALVTSGLLAAGITVLQLADVVLCYRTNMLNMYRGIHLVPAWDSGTLGPTHPARPSSTLCILSCVRYAGYQIAYSIFGWLLNTGILVLLSLLVTLTTFLPSLGLYGYGFWSWFFQQFFYDVSSGGMGLCGVAIVNYVCVWLCVRVLLQHSPGSLAVSYRLRFLFHMVGSHSLTYLKLTYPPISVPSDALAGGLP